MAHDPFAPARLNGLSLRNRIIKSATFEGMSPGGKASGRLVEHHRRLARGGVGMTTVAYCAVSPKGRTFADQMVLTRGSADGLRHLTDAVHAEGAAASVQLSHCGFFTKLPNASRSGERPRSASAGLNRLGLAAGVPFCSAMTPADMAQVARDFALAAARALELGFDAIELHMGHGYLLSQFLSPASNRRTDAYGGSPEGRQRFPLEVFRAVREAVPAGVPVTAKINLDDGFRGGLGIEGAVSTAGALEREGIDALVLSGGFTSRSAFYLLRGGRPLRSMIRNESNPLQKWALRLLGPAVVQQLPFEELFFLPLAQQVRAAVGTPLALVGGVVSREGLQRTMQEGFDFAVMGRALIADPDLVQRMQAGETERSRCNHCNECVAMIEAGGIECALDAGEGSAA